jgi:hypothetical protein
MSVQPTTTRAGQRYLGNSSPSKMEVHDLQNEKVGCQIDEIIAARHAVKFIPDTLDEARRNKYDNCAYCIGNSTR